MVNVLVGEIVQLECPVVHSRTLVFLVYINDLTVGLKCNVKLFADDTSLFTIVQDPNTAANDMNHDMDACGSLFQTSCWLPHASLTSHSVVGANGGSSPSRQSINLFQFVEIPFVELLSAKE